MSINEQIVADLVKNQVSFVTTVPCKQLAGVLSGIYAYAWADKAIVTNVDAPRLVVE